MPIDTNYQVKQGESIDAYNKRIAEYNLAKKPTPTTPNATSPSGTPAYVGNPSINPQFNYNSSQTIGELYGALSPADKAMEDMATTYKGIATAPVDEASIRKNVMDSLQREIDATNAVAAEKLAIVQNVGKNNLGANNAAQARRGTLGSTFGGAQTSEVMGLNARAEQAVLDERNSALASLYTKGRAEANAEISAKAQAMKQGAEAYITFLKETEKRRLLRATNTAKLALAQNVDISILSPDEVSKLATANNVSVEELLTSYQSAKTEKAAMDAELAKTQAETQKLLSTQAKDKRYVTLSDGATLYDTETGQVVADNPKNYAPQSINIGLTPYQQFQAEGSIEKSYTDRTKNARETRRQVNIIDSAFQQVKANLKEGKTINAQSQAMIIALNKILDPESVVREGEFARTAEGASLLNRIDAYGQKILYGGAGVALADLENIVEMSKSLAESSAAYEEQQAQFAKERASRYGLNVNIPENNNTQTPPESTVNNDDPLGIL
jgi:hypothetical protein